MAILRNAVKQKHRNYGRLIGTDLPHCGELGRFFWRLVFRLKLEGWTKEGQKKQEWCRGSLAKRVALANPAMECRVSVWPGHSELGEGHVGWMRGVFPWCGQMAQDPVDCTESWVHHSYSIPEPNQWHISVCISWHLTKHFHKCPNILKAVLSFRYLSKMLIDLPAFTWLKIKLQNQDWNPRLMTPSLTITYHVNILFIRLHIVCT